MIQSELLSIRIFLIKVALKIVQEKYVIIDSILKTNLRTYKIKELNGEKIIGTFYEKEFLLSILSMSYYPEPDSHIRTKIKVVLDLLNYVTKKKMLQALIHLIQLLKINLLLLKLKLTNQTLINLLMLQLDNDKLKTVPMDLRKSSGVVDNEGVKNTKFNTLKAKVNNLENKTPGSIHRNQ